MAEIDRIKRVLESLKKSQETASKIKQEIEQSRIQEEVREEKS